MKHIVILFWLLIPLLSLGQEKTSTLFGNARNWQEVLEIAKNNKKNIFIDFYATWCVPCKTMDKEVFSDPQVAAFINPNFVNVKVQVDTTEKDSPHIKKWYYDAAELVKKYQIKVYPTFLVLTSTGELSQTIEGYHDADKFLALLRDAMDPEQSYTRLIHKYQTHKIPPKNLLSIALKAKKYHNDSLALVMAKEYKTQYFDKQKLTDMLQPDLALLLSNFYDLFRFDAPIITYLYQYPDSADKAMNVRKGYSAGQAQYFISRDLVAPLIAESEQRPNAVPNWDEIERSVARKCDAKTANVLISDHKIFWYRQHKDWENVVKYEIERIENQGLDTAGIGKAMLNNLVFNVIFKHSADTVHLAKGLEYMKLLLNSNPKRYTWIDTYANLLYKIGRKKEGIRYEEKAVTLAIEKNDKERVKEFEATLQLMRANKPTWYQ